MDDNLNATLHTGVKQQLDYVEGLLGKADDPSKSKLAETVIPQWADAWRELLAVHASDERGRCRECSKWWPFRFRRSRCTVWRTAHRNLISEPAEVTRTGRHSLLGQRQTAG
ncbi:hypothetical protein [Amycolatopsis sp. NPDC004079]|uniref:hypothetical protein n=1 Tax=Amycolatopsis sp. NPDC004079 TaxID=3154549 RepID=UPI0033BB3C25